MKKININESDIVIPEGIIGVAETDDVFVYNEKKSIVACCDATKLSVELIFEVDRITELKCNSLESDGKCICSRGPVDEDGNLKCNIKI